MVDWSYFDRFEEITKKYLPAEGEGETMASQIVTAVCKLVYKWYNDGDVYDNSYYMTGWGNDLSSYANWLAKYAGGDTGCDVVLGKISAAYTEGDYELILKELADLLLDDDWLQMMNEYEKTGSIYECDGPFRFVEEEEEDDW